MKCMANTMHEKVSAANAAHLKASELAGAVATATKVMHVPWGI